MQITITSGDAQARDPQINAHRPENMDAAIISGEPPTVVVTLSDDHRGVSLFLTPLQVAALLDVLQAAMRRPALAGAAVFADDNP